MIYTPNKLSLFESESPFERFYARNEIRSQNVPEHPLYEGSLPDFPHRSRLCNSSVLSKLKVNALRSIPRGISSSCPLSVPATV